MLLQIPAAPAPSPPEFRIAAICYDPPPRGSSVPREQAAPREGLGDKETKGYDAEAVRAAFARTTDVAAAQVPMLGAIVAAER